MRRGIAATVVLSVLAIAASACSSSASGTGKDNGQLRAAAGTTPVTGRPTPVANSPKHNYKIAVITAPPELAEFFKAVKAGSTRAGNVLKAYDTEVDYIAVADFTADGINQAMRTAITQHYNAIAVTLIGDANCAPIKEATEKGIKVAAIIGSANCAQSSGALFYHGEDSFTAWQGVAKALAAATGTSPCKVGIITGSFSTEQHEARRTGFIAGLQGTHLSPVSKGVEGGVDPAKIQAAARDYVTANPDLCAILEIIGDNGAAAAALTPDQARKIKVIDADLTTGVVKQIQDGKLYGAYTQDPFGETYDSALWLYNALVTGSGPAGGFLQAVKGSLVTKDNLQAAVQAQDSGA